MANDRHRAVARARHKLRIAKKRKAKIILFENLRREITKIVRNLDGKVYLSLGKLRNIFQEDPLKERELLKQYRCEVVNAYGEKMDIILTARSLFEAEQEAKKSYDQVSNLVEIPASGTLF